MIDKPTETTNSNIMCIKWFLKKLENDQQTMLTVTDKCTDRQMHRQLDPMQYTPLCRRYHTSNNPKYHGQTAVSGVVTFLTIKTAINRPSYHGSIMV